VVNLKKILLTLIVIITVLSLVRCKTGSLSETADVSQNISCWTKAASQVPTPVPSKSQRLLIAFGNRSNTLDLSNAYLLDLTSGQYSWLVSNIEDYGQSRPSPISPEGAYFWYGSFRGPSDAAISIYSMTNGQNYPVAFPDHIYIPLSSIVWSPDGTCLLYWRGNTAFAYHLADNRIDKQTFEGIDFGVEVSPSPDGHWWAWNCREGICLMDDTGQQVHHKALEIPIEGISGVGYKRGLLRWSPDSSRLAFTIASRDRLVPDTIRLVYLKENNILSYRDIHEGADDLRWSLDGQQIFIVAYGSATNLAIYDVQTDKIKWIKLEQEFSTSVRPTWSADGKQIVFVADDNHSIFIMNSDGTGLSAIPSLPEKAEGAEKVAPNYRVIQVFWMP
jgi:hypothetical protein